MNVVAEVLGIFRDKWWVVPVFVGCAAAIWWALMCYEPRPSARIVELLKEKDMKVMERPATVLTPEEVARAKESIRQVDAIWALEGFEPDDVTRTIDVAVLAGRVTFGQAANEMDEYIEAHKTTDGFIETRSWA
ncbi:MAG: antitoxin VbhA family protein [Burkholderiaceae bacterium]|jgi:hypothetical protein|nr:antitoxin VbhA family protein [Burkholderiaceae bacterium]